MQISRIEAFNPNKINWQMLTARQIIKYQERGVEVPNVYLQWAQNFINSVNNGDNDDITYEKAMNVQDVEQTSVDSQPNFTEETTNNVDSGENLESIDESGDDDSESEPQLSAAQQSRKQMNDDGVSLYDQSKTFVRTSRSLANESFWSSLSLKSLQSSSDDEISHLDMHMKLLLSEAEEQQNKFKSEINKVNSGTSDYSYQKIMDLQRQLEHYGISGQAEIAQSIGKLNNYSADINSLSDIFAQTLDYGNETVSIGSELLASGNLWNMGTAFTAIAFGSYAMKQGTSGEAIKQIAQTVNDSNTSQAYSFSSDVESKTGVEALHKQNSKADEQNQDESDSIKEREENSQDPSMRELEINQADSSSKASLDEILKRKIRRGEATEDINS